MANVSGTKKADVLKGTSTSDVIRGEGGADTLWAGLGLDYLHGGADADLFVIGNDAILQPLKPAQLAAVIWDFNPDEGDKIDLSRIDLDQAAPYRQGLFLSKTSNGGIASEFSKRDGEVIVQYDSGNLYVRGDINGDGNSDFSVLIKQAEIAKPSTELRQQDFSLVGSDEISFLGRTDGQSFSGNVRNETIYGGSGNDKLWGYSGNDVVVGGKGHDSLFGGTGADTLVADAGLDTLSGGNDKDQDIFLFTEASLKQNPRVANLAAIVKDFDYGRDLLDFSSIDVDAKKAGRQSFFLSQDGVFNNKAGELVLSKVQQVSGGWLTTISGDVDGRGGADFKIDVFTNSGKSLAGQNFRF